MYVFDASAIVNLVKKGKAKIFASGLTLDLALYESINAVWKEHELLKRMDKDTALEFVDTVSRVLDITETVSIKGIEKEVFDLSSREDLSIYNASYVYIAIKNHYTLVTDDEKLREKATKYVNVVSSNELAGAQQVDV